MESEIESLKSELENSKTREQTNLKLYQELLKVLQDQNDSCLSLSSSEELKIQSDLHHSELKRLKQEHTQVLKTQAEHISNLKDHIKDLEFQTKSEKLSYQQQILDLQGQILVLKSDLSHFQSKSKEESCQNPSILRKQAEHIENLTAELAKVKEDHKSSIQQLELQGQKTIKELEEMYEQDKHYLRSQITQFNKEFDEKLALAENECEARAKLTFIEEIEYLNCKVSRLLTERNEAQAKLEIFRTEVQNLRDHINSPIVQKNIREKVIQAKRFLDKTSNSKEDVASLKGILLHLEDRFARMQENEKIYHRLLLQKEVEIKNMKEFNRELNKKFPKMASELQESKNSTLASVEHGLFGRKSQSFSGSLPDDSTPRRKNETKEYSESRLIDELALFKVKYALFEEIVSERDEKIKNLVKKTKEIVEKNSENYTIKQNLHFIMQILKQPITVQELQLEEAYCT